MPITWKNVNGNTGHRDAAAILDGAGRSLNKGLDSLGGILNEAQTIQEDNYQNERSNNTQAYLDKLASFGDVGELQAAQSDGSLDTFLAGLGNNIDKNQVRGAADTRLNALRSAESTTREYELSKLRADNAPLLEQIEAANARGNTQLRDSLIASNADTLDKLGIRGDLIAQGIAADKQRLTEGRTERAYQQKKYVTQAINKLGKTIGEQATKNEENFLAKAAEFGIPLKNGKLDYSSASPDAIKQFKQAVKNDSNLQQPSHTQQLNSMLGDIRNQYPDMPHDLLNQAYEQAIGVQARLNGLAPEDQKKVNLTIENAHRQYDMNKNDFMATEQEGYTPAAATSEIISSVLGTNEELADEWDGDGDTKNTITTQVQAALSDGITINGEVFPVTPAMAKNALQQFHADWFEDDGENKFEQAISDYVRTDGYKKQYENFQKYQEIATTAMSRAKAQYGPGAGVDARLQRLQSFKPQPKKSQQTPESGRNIQRSRNLIDDLAHTVF